MYVLDTTFTQGCHLQGSRFERKECTGRMLVMLLTDVFLGPL